MGNGNRKLVGIGGWLRFFILTTGVLVPYNRVRQVIELMSNAETAEGLGDLWPLMSGLEIGQAAIVVLGGWYLVWRLVMVELWRTVQIVIAGIWILWVGLLLLKLAALGWVVGSFAFLPPLAAAYLLIPAIVIASLWTAYFLRSERVAKTYLRDPYPRSRNRY